MGRLTRSLRTKPARALGLCIAMAFGGGCGGVAASRPGSEDPQRMSESEYDVARDYWLSRGQPREALKHGLRAVELDPDNADANHLVALIYLDFCQRTPEECRLGEAEKHARQALSAREDYREARNTLGVTLIHQKRYQEAVRVLKPLTEDILYQTPENAWGNLGWAYLEQGQLEAAVEALRRSVAAQPLFCVGHYRLGLAYERKKQPEKANISLTQALETPVPACKGLQDAYAARAKVRFQLGQIEEAEADLEQCVALNKQSQVGKECRSKLRKLK